MILDRTKRVKEARDEAKKEVDAYKKEKDDEFKKYESEVRSPPVRSFARIRRCSVVELYKGY